MIECSKNNMKYVGSTVRQEGFYGRYRQYCTDTCKFNTKMQNVINKYGFDSLVFKMIKSYDASVPSSVIRREEEKFIKNLCTFNTYHGLNMRPHGTGGNGGANKGKIYPPVSQVTIEKRKKALKGIPKPPRTREHSRKISLAKKGSPPTNFCKLQVEDTLTNTVTIYNTILEAANKLDGDYSTIRIRSVEQKKILYRGRYRIFEV